MFYNIELRCQCYRTFFFINSFLCGINDPELPFLSTKTLECLASAAIKQELLKRLLMLTRDKHSSLFSPGIINERKKRVL